YELSAVDGIGLTDVEMDLVVSLVSDYVHGAVRGAVQADALVERTGMTDEEWWRRAGPILAEVLEPERFPLAARAGAAAGAEYGAASDPERAFEFGLRMLLDRVAAYLRARSEATTGVLLPCVPATPQIFAGVDASRCDGPSALSASTMESTGSTRSRRVSSPTRPTPLYRASDTRIG